MNVIVDEKKVPVVSVIMPVHNAEDYLSDAIESILNQSFQSFELVIVNDGSNDKSAEILDYYACKDERIIVHTMNKNMGLITTLNYGCQVARGKYIARMDSDDISLPNRFGKQVRYMDENHSVGLLGSAVQVIDENGVSGVIWKFPETHGVIKWIMCFYDPLVHPVVMIRREIISHTQYRKERKHAEDYDLWSRLIWNTKAANLPDVLLQLRKHKASISSTHYDEQKNVGSIIQRDMINRVLEDDIAIEVIEVFKQKGRIEKLAYSNALHLIGRLYRKFQRCEDLGKEELKAIKSDAICRLMGLGRRRFPRIDSMSILYHMSRIDIFLSMSMFFTWAKEKFRKG